MLKLKFDVHKATFMALRTALRTEILKPIKFRGLFRTHRSAAHNLVFIFLQRMDRFHRHHRISGINQ